ncbi:MAG: hypothetical protein ACRCSE_11460 [Vibrio sp.]
MSSSHVPNFREEFSAKIPALTLLTHLGDQFIPPSDCLVMRVQNDDQLMLFSESNTSDLSLAMGEFDLPDELHQMIDALTPKARKESLWPVIVWLYSLRPYKAEQLAVQLSRKVGPLKNTHLNVLRENEGLIDYLYPEVVNHPNQGFVA